MRKFKCLIGGLACLYVAGAVFFRFHYYPKATVNGIEAGWKTPEYMIEKQRENLKEAEYIITTPDEDENAWLKNEEEKKPLLVLDDEVDFDLILSERYAFLWPVDVFKKHAYSAGKIKVDDTAVMEVSQELFEKNPEEKVKAQDAKLKYDEASKQYAVIPDRIGNQVTLDDLHDTLSAELQKIDLKAINKKEPIVLSLEGCYEQPAIKTDSEAFLKAKKKLNKYLKTQITYESERGNVVLDADVIHEFLCWDKKFNVSISEEAVRDYVINSICAAYNTVGDKRTFTSKGSGKITVTGGNYGWIVSTDKETEKLISEIKKGIVESRKPVYSQEAKSDKKNDIGKSYIDVSIADQHLWLIKDNKVILSSDVVTGNPSTGHATPKGTFFIEYKTTNYTMRRYDAHVDYWMPIDTSTGVGLHDASWRSSFGGSIYARNGSHGCINLPTSVARKIYQTCEAGYPVIVH